MKLKPRSQSYALPAYSPVFVLGVQPYPELNPLNPSALFHYPYALYSPGNAQLNPKKWDKEEIIHKRYKRKTFLMADSAGYQVIKGKGAVQGVDWNSKRQADNTRLKLLRWIEAVADAAPNLDIPLAALQEDNIYQSRQDCLDWTLRHWDFQVANMNPKSGVDWLNCLHGHNTDFGIKWHKAVKNYPSKEHPAAGWAIGSNLKNSFFNTMWMMLYLRDKEQLKNKKQIHFFGIMHERAGMVYTHLQRLIQKSVNPKLVITYDSSSPFLTAAKGNELLPKELNKSPNNKKLMKMPNLKIEKGTATEQYIEIMAENLRVYMGAIAEAHLSAMCEEKTQGGKHKGRYFRKYWEVVDIMNEAWASSQWDTVLTRHKKTLEKFLK